MKKRKKYRAYFFDYLWWLGEKQQEKNPGSKLDGSTMYMYYFLVFICMPLIMILQKASPYFHDKLRLMVVLGLLYLLWEFWLNKIVFNQDRCKAIMKRFASCKYSSTRAHVFLLLPIVLFLTGIFTYISYDSRNKYRLDLSPENRQEAINRMVEDSPCDSSFFIRPLSRQNKK